MRTSKLALATALLLIGGCVDQPTQVPEPEPEPPPPPLGVYRFEITGIGSPAPDAGADMVIPGPAMSLTPAAAGLALEPVSTSSFSEGGRAGGEDGHRYVSATFRVRNSTGAPVSNVTFIPVSSNSTISGTPFLAVRKFNGTNASATLAERAVPTGAVALGEDLQMRALYPDVMQVYLEAEVSAITLPAGKTGIFPYGFVVRNAREVSRTLPAATGANDFGGMLTITYRIPLASAAADDVFSFVFDAIAVQDTEIRLTESIEESQDTAAVRMLRARAIALGATTVTVLNGSPAMDPAVPNYPGQRQICSSRVSGPVASPVARINAPGPYSRVAFYYQGESLTSCPPYFRSGTPMRPATNVGFGVYVRAMDRYGNRKMTITDTVSIAPTGGPPMAYSGPKALVDGGAFWSVTFSDYGTSTLNGVGRRNRGWRPVTVAGVTRTWRGVVSTDWTNGANWLDGAAPMSLDSVLIPNPKDGPHYPVLVSNVSIHGVTVDNGATISIGPFNLTAAANVATGTSGGIDGTSGRVELTGFARTVRGVLPRMRVTGTYSLNGNLTSRAPLEIPSGRITNASFRIQTSSF